MRVYELSGVGIDHLVQRQREVPAPGPGEVAVRVAAASVNYRDYALMQGTYQADMPKPFVPLSDGAGTVVETGRGVTRFAPGDRVVGHYTTGWLDGPFSSANHATKLGGPLDGWLAETVVLPEQALLPVPGYLTLEEAATLPVSALTAWTALDGAEGLNGQRVLIEGTGSVSLAALQIARAAGAETVVLSGKTAHHADLRRLGADHVLDYRGRDDLPAVVRELTAGHGIDRAVEVVGGDGLLQTLAMMADGGIVSVVGFLQGFAVDGNLIGPMIARQLSLRGVSVGSRAQFEALLAFMEQRRIHPVVGARYAFDDAPRAIRDLGERRGYGKPVIAMT
ncbi:zinc-dependent alcohol dehydrogenase family protein [Arhodomonas sp. AD133]|uniref:zinc-dependent alcohol dehydrogenase family protein n=1 Tax=Arhodomonas sp. AD133 TaxID=3415009 RepID=UPI003EBF6958